MVQVVPSQLHLAFDTRSTRDVEIHPRVTGNFADGLQIVKVEADPPRITITGPRHHVERVDSATTDPVDASGATGKAVFTTNVYVPDPLVQVVQTTSIRVTVTVQKVGSATPTEARLLNPPTFRAKESQRLNLPTLQASEGVTAAEPANPPAAKRRHVKARHGSAGCCVGKAIESRRDSTPSPALGGSFRSSKQAPKPSAFLHSHLSSLVLLFPYE